MAIISYPVTLLKGQANEVTMDKMAVFASSPGLSDESFIGTESRGIGMTAGQSLKAYGTSLLRAVVALKADGNQMTTVSFNMIDEFPNGILRVTNTARDEFLFNQVALIDKDGDARSTTRKQIGIPSELDADFSP